MNNLVSNLVEFDKYRTIYRLQKATIISMTISFIMFFVISLLSSSPIFTLFAGYITGMILVIFVVLVYKARGIITRKKFIERKIQTCSELEEFFRRNNNRINDDIIRFYYDDISKY